MTDPLELWVGAEPTVNRVEHIYLDQIERTGFDRRVDDIDRLASLRPRRMRFPLLWERTETSEGDYDFTWADDRLARLRHLGIEPIVGLLHHGSGPRHTHLLDADFPFKLAAYARVVARRYPWIAAWTPINEPLTTARFSGLYGFWYPHGKCDAAFVRALLNQMHASVMAMAEVRVVNPDALLIQTEDLGHTSSTSALQYQADFDNARRWLSFDLLAGRVNNRHPLRQYLLDNGAADSELAALEASRLKVDIVGVNAYVTSERFLDDRLDLYPDHPVGGNGRARYVDVEAVRVASAPFGGFKQRLVEAGARYGLPLALTEAHLGCTREEQMRWLWEAWQAAQSARARGVDVRAVTAWSAFGAFDWHNLLTRRDGRYESGLWDVRGANPRPTALVTLARQLGSGSTLPHPVLAVPGWWRRDVRVPESQPDHRVDERATRQADLLGDQQPILIAGAGGTLGHAFARVCGLRGLPYRALPRGDLDITRAPSIEAALQRWRPWAVVNAAGYVRVDEAEQDGRQWEENALGPVRLARACQRAEIPLLTFSSDLVFDGAKADPYLESDLTGPLSAYGRAKESADRALQSEPGVLTIRTAAFFGPWDRHNFVSRGLALLEQGLNWSAAEDQTISPTYVPELVHCCLDLLIDGEQGLWHLANRGALSWYDFACRTAEAAGQPTRLITPIRTSSQVVRRPRYSALGSSRGQLIGALDDAIAQYHHAVASLRRVTPAPIAACAAQGVT